MPQLKNPPPSADWLNSERAKVNDGIDEHYPVAATPPAQYGGYPQPGDLDDALVLENVDGVSLLADHLTVMGYVPVDGSFGGNAQRRSDCFVNSKPPISRTIADCLSGGYPIPGPASFVPPPLSITFSESEVKTRLLETPPRRYDGAPCYDPNNTQVDWNALNASAVLAMKADPAFRGMSDDVMNSLAVSQWGKGQAYYPTGFDAVWARTKTAAEIFWKYDPRGKQLWPDGATD